MYQHVISEGHVLLRNQLLQNNALTLTLREQLEDTLAQNCFSLADSLCSDTRGPKVVTSIAAKYLILSGVSVDRVVQHITSQYTQVGPHNSHTLTYHTCTLTHTHTCTLALSQYTQVGPHNSHTLTYHTCTLTPSQYTQVGPHNSHTLTYHTCTITVHTGRPSQLTHTHISHSHSHRRNACRTKSSQLTHTHISHMHTHTLTGEMLAVPNPSQVSKPGVRWRRGQRSIRFLRPHSIRLVHSSSSEATVSHSPNLSSPSSGTWSVMCVCVCDVCVSVCVCVCVCACVCVCDVCSPLQIMGYRC